MSEHTRDASMPGLDNDALDALLEAAWEHDPAAHGGLRLGSTVLDSGRYQDFRRIGVGGMGVVFLAFDTELNRPVAIKVVRPPGSAAESDEGSRTPFDFTPPPLGSEAAVGYADLTKRFLQEAWITSALEHPGIVPVHELGRTPQGVPYYTMRYVRGIQTLEQALDAATSAKERFDLLPQFLQVCDTLRYAHARGVIHRDLKPANIGLGVFGEVVVLDWGLAKMRGESDETGDSMWHDRLRDFRESQDMHTMAQALGTPGYMSPESARGDLQHVDERSDVYSLGAILYRILTGRLPFLFKSYAEFLRQLREEHAPAACEVEPSVPIGLSEICAKALAPAKEDRHAGAGELADSVRNHQRRSRVRAEIRELLNEAVASFEVARELEGEARLRRLDRVRALCLRVLERRKDHGRARQLLASSDLLRRRTAEEREQALQEEAERTRRASLNRERARHREERERQRRALRRVAAVVLGLVAIGAGVAAWTIEGKRREADAARAEQAGLLARLGVTKRDRDAAWTQAERLIAERAAERTELEKLRADVTRETAEAELRRRALTGAQAQVDDLESRLRAAQDELARQGGASPDTQSRIESLEQDLAASRASLEQSEAARVAAEQRRDEVGHALAEKEAEVQKLTTDVGALNARVTDLLDELDGDEAPTDFEQYVDGLERTPGSKALRLLERVTLRVESEQRAVALAALGRRGRTDPDAVAFLVECLEERFDGDVETQARILAALGATGSEDAVGAIIAFLQKSESGTDGVLRRAGNKALVQLRTRDSLKYLLEGVNTGGDSPTRDGRHLTRKAQGPPLEAMRALRDITGLPFETQAAWLEWGRHSRNGWTPPPLEAAAPGRELRHEGWRFRVTRTDEERWVSSVPEDAVLLLAGSATRGGTDAAWVAVDAVSGIESFPQQDGESTRDYGRRRWQEAIARARARIPESLRSPQDTVTEGRAVIDGTPARELTAEGETQGTWRVLVTEKNELVYTLVVHHGSEASPDARQELEKIVGSFRFLDD